MEQEHPLLKCSGWKFSQPEIGYATKYTVTNPDTGQKATKTLKVSNTCREGVIHDTRQALRTVLTVRDARPRQDWDSPVGVPLAGEIDLSSGNKKTELVMVWYDTMWKHHGGGEEALRNFLRMCDAIAGPVCVLLGIHRPEGDWWKTDPTKALGNWKNRDYQAVYWKGTDNWFLAHPAAMSIALGLYRQCYLLCRTDCWKDILKLVSEEEIDEVMSTGSQVRALKILKRTRPFIEVPPAENSSAYNFPFALGFWKRLLCLQRALRRHGYEKSFDQSFSEGWNLLHSSNNLSGVYTHWGNQDNLTDSHRKLLELGAVRKRIRRASGQQQAKADARKGRG